MLKYISEDSQIKRERIELNPLLDESVMYRLVDPILLEDLDSLGTTLHGSEMHGVAESVPTKFAQFPFAGAKIYYSARTE